MEFEYEVKKWFSSLGVNGNIITQLMEDTEIKIQPPDADYFLHEIILTHLPEELGNTILESIDTEDRDPSGINCLRYLHEEFNKHPIVDTVHAVNELVRILSNEISGKTFPSANLEIRKLFDKYRQLDAKLSKDNRIKVAAAITAQRLSHIKSMVPIHLSNANNITSQAMIKALASVESQSAGHRMTREAKRPRLNNDSPNALYYCMFCGRRNHRQADCMVKKQTGAKPARLHNDIHKLRAKQEEITLEQLHKIFGDNIPVPRSLTMLMSINEDASEEIDGQQNENNCPQPYSPSVINMVNIIKASKEF